MNHPNIAAIYGVEDHALVMELVDGAEPRGPLAEADALAIIEQLIDALEYAHERGVVHRDLKPANLKITPDGRLKVLDFGLAKAMSGDTAAGNPLSSPTLTMGATMAGTIMGTAAYMAPEQARGHNVDQRTDIWAFGVMVYELLTGKLLFEGPTISDTLASVLRQEIDLNAVPPRFHPLLRACLERDPKRRLRHIGDARLLLAQPPAQAAAATPSPSKLAWLPWAVAAIAMAMAAVAAGMTWLRPKAADPGPAMRFLVPLPPGTAMPLAGSAPDWVPSPDGRNLAMIAMEGNQNALWVRPIGATSAHRLDKTEGADFPFWSPDGRSIGFFTEDKLKRIAVSGGAVQTVCPVPATRPGFSNGDGATWSADNFMIFGTATGPLMRVPAAGGIPAPVTTLEKDESSHTWPQLLPDGRHVLYLARAGDNSAIYVQELGSNKRIRVRKVETRAVWSPQGYLLFGREGTLFAQRMNPKTFQLEGEALTVADEIRFNNRTGRSTFAVSQNGVLVYRGGANDSQRQLNWRDRTGKVLSTVGQPGEFRSLSLSPDGKSAALVSGPPQGPFDAWVIDLASGVRTPMTRDGKQSISNVPAWSPDSERLAVSPATGGVQPDHGGVR